MSVDYDSVLIYGYRITAEEVARLEKNIGEEAWDAAKEKYCGSAHYNLVRENGYCDSDYYFGITLGKEIDLDAVDSLCWYEYETGAMDEELESILDSLSYVDSDRPTIYHFVRVS